MKQIAVNISVSQKNVVILCGLSIKDNFSNVNIVFTNVQTK